MHNNKIKEHLSKGVNSFRITLDDNSSDLLWVDVECKMEGVGIIFDVNNTPSRYMIGKLVDLYRSNAGGFFNYTTPCTLHTMKTARTIISIEPINKY